MGEEAVQFLPHFHLKTQREGEDCTAVQQMEDPITWPQPKDFPSSRQGSPCTPPRLEFANTRIRKTPLAYRLHEYQVQN